MHSFHPMSVEKAFCTSFNKQFFDIGIDPFSFSLRILALRRKFTKCVSILKIGTFPFFCQCSKIPLKQMAKTWEEKIKPLPNSRKENKLLENKKSICVLQYLLNGGIY